MKKVLSILSILLVMVTLSAATISSPAATVNLTKNKVITMDQLNKEVELYTKNGVSVQQIDVLNSLIDEILIEQGAARDGYSVTDSEVEQLYANQKKSVEAQAGRTLTDAEFESLVTEVELFGCTTVPLVLMVGFSSPDGVTTVVDVV